MPLLPSDWQWGGMERAKLQASVSTCLTLFNVHHSPERRLHLQAEERHTRSTKDYD